MIHRRRFLAQLGAALLSPAAGIPEPGRSPAPLLRILNRSPSPEVDISYGQSWRTATYDSFGAFGWHPEAAGLLACRVTRQGRLKPFPGPMPNGAGISLPGKIDGVTRYTGADPITIGRCAVLAQQLLRRAAGASSVAPILEFCAGFPASTWTTGRGGGLQPGGRSWTNMLTIIRAIEAMPSQGVLSGASFRSVGYTQGGSAINTVMGKIADLTAMCADFDALRLPGTASKPLDFYFEIAAPAAWVRRLQPSAWGTYVFCRENRNGRSWGVSPWYQWPFDSVGRIHLNAYGTARLGEMEGYARFVREDEGGGRESYRPLWRSLTRPLIVHGQDISVPFDRPSGVGFAPGVLAWKSDPDDGIKEWPQYGWHVRRDGTDLTVRPAIRGLDVRLEVAERLNPGDELEVSYAFYGPGRKGDRHCSGVGGNLMMAGPPSPLFPGKTINAWAWPFVETLRV